jgi:hypothetical protein
MSVTVPLAAPAVAPPTAARPRVARRLAHEPARGRPGLRRLYFSVVVEQPEVRARERRLRRAGVGAQRHRTGRRCRDCCAVTASPTGWLSRTSAGTSPSRRQARVLARDRGGGLRVVSLALLALLAAPRAVGTSDERRLSRYGVAGLAAVSWLLLGVESVLRPGQHNYRDALWLVPWLLTAAALRQLHLAQRSPAARLERWSYGAVIAAMAGCLAGNLGLLLDIDALELLGFPLGALLWTLALVPFGIATVRAGEVPRHVGIALALLEPGSILTGLALSPIAGLSDRGGYSSGIEKALVLWLVARALAEHRTCRSAQRAELAQEGRPRARTSAIANA